jgi:hypothetical protein
MKQWVSVFLGTVFLLAGCDETGGVLTIQEEQKPSETIVCEAGNTLIG